jgi:hypothetical protein
MRKSPKSLATLREIVDERGQQLRNLAQEELKEIATAPLEQLRVELRPATIGIIIQPKPDGSLRVIIQGFMKAHFVPGTHVALDGFYKHRDGTVKAITAEEFCEFD